jgi:hypothetical protein
LALIKIQGEQIPVLHALRNSSQLLSPAILIHTSGRCDFRTLALRLAGVTALQEKRLKNSVRQVATAVVDPERWTSEEAQRVLMAVGTVGAPESLDVRRVKSQNLITFRIPQVKTQSVMQVKYPRKSSRGTLSLRTWLAEEGIKIPPRMYMEIPVALAEDDTGLVLAAFQRHGVLKSITDLTPEPEESVDAR